MRKAAIAAGMVAVLLLPSSATALCRGPAPLAEAFPAAELVFSGTVILTAGRDRAATVEVDTVWKGHEVPAETQVWGTENPFPSGGFESIGSLDRSFQIGVRYVFFPVSNVEPYLDNSCTLTQVVTFEVEEALVDLAGGEGTPPIPMVPVEDLSEEQSAIPWWLLPSAVGALVAGLAIVARKRRPVTLDVQGFRLSGDREVGPD